MLTLKLPIDVKDDRRIEIILPPDVPFGAATLLVTILPASASSKRSDDFSLGAWSDKYAEDLGDAVRSDDVEGFTGRRY